jgi:dTDP-4-dehydrorhamnose 3,5-epimerase
MTVEHLSISGVWSFTPPRYSDERGWFSETFNAETLKPMLAGVTFVQDNQSLSRRSGTLRGLHFQIPPKAQHKLVRVLRGAVLDVAVDIRRASPTYGQAVSAVLSAENGKQLFIPVGFAHGFLTLEPDTDVVYKVSELYSREHERGLVWSDPDIGIDWGISPEQATIAERDIAFPRLSALESYF